MALFAIGDPHLSFSANKSMEVFGGRWIGYVEKLRKGFEVVSPEDTVILCGDLSWGMNLQQCREDFAFLNALPGKRKLIIKGNHDYWWNTVKKMEEFFRENGFDTFQILQNNCAFYEDIALCGTRGWFLDEEKKPHNEKIFHRELIRLEMSLQAAGDHRKLCFLHYPPLYQGYRCQEIIDLMTQYGVEECYYAHLHGNSHRLAIHGDIDGIQYHLVAGDYLDFVPRKIMD